IAAWDLSKPVPDAPPTRVLLLATYGKGWVVPLDDRRKPTEPSDAPDSAPSRPKPNKPKPQRGTDRNRAPTALRMDATMSTHAADGSAGDPNYGIVGHTYTTYRQPEPLIAERIIHVLGQARPVLNVGAGAGSYEPLDRNVTAVEPSASMR